jgi:hypothetical protein
MNGSLKDCQYSLKNNILSLSMNKNNIIPIIIKSQNIKNPKVNHFVFDKTQQNCLKTN